ncbi:YnfA family protein [Minwuia sp.]|uniref:YnfA family protein n=1 Tax=Minwuia sp. TaxID=2493630 RepID=UPI003A93BE9D
MQTSFLFLGAAVAEIAGCFAFWAWIRMDRSVLWLFPGIASLILFAVLLTLVDSEYAGRAYAAYGGVYIGSALLWLWVIEDQQPDLWDVSGASLCLLGALIIIFGPRSA